MKIKLNASVFHDPMPFNTITIDKDKIKIHSFDGTGMGILRVAKLEQEVEEPATFTLSAKDYSFISKLGDFTLDYSDNAIKVSNAKIKAKFANVVDYPVYTPNINNLHDINVALDDLLPGMQFIGSDPTYPQAAGVNVFTDKVIASDKMMFYTHAAETGLAEPINIPGEAFKHIPAVDNLKLQTNGKMLVAKTPGRSFYTALIEQKLPSVKVEDKVPLFNADLPRDEVTQALKLIKEYSKYVTISANGSGVKLYAGEEGSELAIQVAAKIEGDAVDLSFNITKLMKILSVIKEDTIKVLFGSSMLICEEANRGNRYALGRYIMPVKKSETKEKK